MLPEMLTIKKIFGAKVLELVWIVRLELYCCCIIIVRLEIINLHLHLVVVKMIAAVQNVVLG